jgi:hypothetical protein
MVQAGEPLDQPVDRPPFMPAFSRATGRPTPATVVRHQPPGLLGRDLRGDPDQAFAQILATVQLRD